jgi:hypothetical protein
MVRGLVSLSQLTNFRWLIGDHIFGLLPLLASMLNGAGGTADGVEDPRIHTVQNSSDVCTFAALRLILLSLTAFISQLKFTGPLEPGHMSAMASSIHIPSLARLMSFTNCGYLLTHQMETIPLLPFMRPNLQTVVTFHKQTVFGQTCIMTLLFQFLPLPSYTPCRALVML